MGAGHILIQKSNYELRTKGEKPQKVFDFVSGLWYCKAMNENVETQVFCSQCDQVTSNFVEWGDEFYCQEQCYVYLPTEALMEEQDFSNADQDWLVSAGWGDDEDYGYYGD